MNEPNIFSRLWKAPPQCPECSAVLDQVTATDGKHPEPKPGDASACLYCATLLRFKSDLTLERMPDDVLAALPAEDRKRALHIQKIARAVSFEARMREAMRQRRR